MSRTAATTGERLLIAINYQDRVYQITDLHPAVSICNFDYAIPDAVMENRHLNRVIADDETGFSGQLETPYRKEAWAFLLAGGGLFSHLDYSFTTSFPNGKAPTIGATPDYGSEDLRRQLAFMRSFLEEIEVWRLRPCNEIAVWRSESGRTLAMADLGRLYAIYFSDIACPIPLAAPVIMATLFLRSM